LELESHLYKIVSEWRRTHLPNDEKLLEVLLTKKKHLEKTYVEVRMQKTKLWNAQEQLEASERCLLWRLHRSSCSVIVYIAVHVQRIQIVFSISNLAINVTLASEECGDQPTYRWYHDGNNISAREPRAGIVMVHTSKRNTDGLLGITKLD
jgi:hypothetical protein